MSSYSGGRIEIYCDDAPKELENQFLECYGIYTDEYGFFEREINDTDSMDIAEELDNIYATASALFGNTYLHYTEEDNDDNTDWYSGYEASYNEDDSGKKNTRLYDYCYGENTANGENCWEILKEEIESEARKKKIAIDWDEEYDLAPNKDNDRFTDLCDKILDKHGGLEELSTTRNSTIIVEIIINQQKIKEILEEAKKKNYIELYKTIESKLDDKGFFPPSIAETIKHTNNSRKQIRNTDNIKKEIEKNMLKKHFDKETEKELIKQTIRQIKEIDPKNVWFYWQKTPNQIKQKLLKNDYIQKLEKEGLLIKSIK